MRDSIERKLEAANAEIARLRADLARLRDERDVAIAALKIIARGHGVPIPAEYRDFWTAKADQFSTIARKALEDLHFPRDPTSPEAPK